MFDAIAPINNESKFFAWGSPCMQYVDDSGETSQINIFPYYFIQFDLNSEGEWKNEYNKWKLKFCENKKQ